MSKYDPSDHDPCEECTQPFASEAEWHAAHFATEGLGLVHDRCCTRMECVLFRMRSAVRPLELPDLRVLASNPGALALVDEIAGLTP